MSDRDRRALLFLGPAVALFLIFWLFTQNSGPGSGVASSDAVAQAELRLRKLRLIAANLPAKQEVASQKLADLDLRQKTLINAQDEKLAQERLLDIVQKLAQSQAPALYIRSKELGQPKPYGAYGEVLVTLVVDCRIDQLVNFLSDLSAQPEAIATEEVHVFGSNPETKQMQIRLTIGGLMPGRLLPKKKEIAEF